MQINDLKSVSSAPPPKRQDDNAVITLTERRIYVWSSPSPYAVVIQESRSFHRHI